MSEKREYPRLKCGFEVMLISNGNFFHDTLVNISEGGAQIALSRSLKLARDVLIRTTLNHRPIVVLGDILWSKSGNSSKHIGVRFLYLPPAACNKIRALIRGH